MNIFHCSADADHLDDFDAPRVQMSAFVLANDVANARMRFASWALMARYGLRRLHVVELRYTTTQLFAFAAERFAAGFDEVVEVH